MKIKKNDEVIVQIGKDKGKMGRVESVLEKKNKIVLPGINEFKRHIKGRMQGQKSEIITITKPMLVSKVALLCPKCHKPTRIGFRMEKDLPAGRQGKKVRFCKKCEAVI